jgi:hypothetical protein
MWERLRTFWLPRALFLGTLCCATGLAVAVGAAPWMATQMTRPNRAVHLFAEDLAVRRTALASSIGLAVTAFVFFRPPAPRPAKKSSKNSPPGNIAGA